MTKAKLVVMRHARTKCNELMLMTGQLDVPLIKAGEGEAWAAGSLIRHIRFDKAYSSYLSRAFDTEVYALESSGTQEHLRNPNGTWKIEKRSEISEMDVGDFTGLNFTTDPKIVNYNWKYDVPLPGGESEKQVLERVEDFFNKEIKPRLDKGENILIVTHAGILRVLEIILGFEKIPEKAILATTVKSLPNATPLVYEFEDGEIKGSPYIIQNSVEQKTSCQTSLPLVPATAASVSVPAPN